MGRDNDDREGPTRRIEDWKPFNPSGSGGTGETARADAPPGAATSGGSGAATQFFRPAAPPGSAGATEAAAEPVDFMSDPVVGWVVVIQGPGKGVGLRLGVGMNSIGRNETNRVRLDFGDGRISREKHCVITFEPKQRVFYIQNEGGQNLTYVGDTVVLQAQELHNGETIQVGDTELRFVALCGPEFAWSQDA